MAPADIRSLGGRSVVDEQQQRDKIQNQVARSGAGGAFSGGGTLFTEPILVVNQKTKIIELTNEYTVFDAAGNRLGGVRQVGQSTAKKLLRALASVDQFLTHRLEVTDAAGSPVLVVTRPAKILKSTVVVENTNGGELGRIVQENAIGKIRFRMESGGVTVGMLRAKNWRAWNFSITNDAEQEVARITKTFEGVARTLFTTADHYVVQIHQQLEEPLRSLVVAAALCVDTALKQDARGLG
jgi:uncharacterized protein YxjI